MIRIRISLSVVFTQLYFSLSMLGQGTFFDFQQVPTGTLPGGFLQLENNGVTAFFSGNGTSITKNSITGQNAIHLATFQGQMGVQFDVAASEIQFVFDGSIPGPAHAMKIPGHYTENYSIINSGNSAIYRTATVVHYRPTTPVWGLLLENVDTGFALSSVSIVPVPEPSTIAILASSGVIALTCRVLRK